MKIDCTKCLFFILLLVHVVARTDELYGWYTKYSQQLLFILRCKKTKSKALLQSLFVAHHECTN